MPVIVPRSIGRTAYTVSATSAVRVPMPPTNGSGIRNPNSARLGMVCARLASATIGLAIDGRRAATMPSGMPIAAATAVDANTRMTCSPSRAMNSARCAGDEGDELAHRSPTSAATRGSDEARTAAGVSHATICPSLKTAMRSASANASAMSCVTSTTVAPQRRLQPLEFGVQLGLRDRIERAERLVHQQQLRIGRQRARQADALTLATGQLIGPSIAVGRRDRDRPSSAARRRAR